MQVFKNFKFGKYWDKFKEPQMKIKRRFGCEQRYVTVRMCSKNVMKTFNFYKAPDNEMNFLK